MRRSMVPLGLIVLASTLITSAATFPTLHFRVFARTGLRLTDIIWTGRQFLYVTNTSNQIFASSPAGKHLRLFARMPRQVEETRCAISPGSHGFPSSYLYCHSPDNKIYRIGTGGKSAVFAILPHSPRSDGAIAFDSVGTFGYSLLAATGRSGGRAHRGGTVFAISQHGKVRRIGMYHNIGGADEIAVAPPSFGSVSGQVLLAVDAGKRGSLLAMNLHGRTRTLVRLPDGPNPLVVLPHRRAPAGAAKPGLYVADTLSRNVYFAPATDLRPFAGIVVVGSELRGLFWIVRPHGHEFTVSRLRTTLRGKRYNLEGAIYIAG